MCLDKIKDCEIRVKQRVKEGGHAVDARTIKGVYEQNLLHINNYKNTFKVICLYDGTGRPRMLVKIEDNQLVMAIEDSLKKNWIKNRLPAIYNMIQKYLPDQK